MHYEPWPPFTSCAMHSVSPLARAWRDFPDRRLACIEPVSRYPELKAVMGGRIKIEPSREHWGDILRLVASLKVGVVAPSAMLKKLAAYERQNRLDRALQECGRLVRTGFDDRLVRRPRWRRRCHAGLNKSEQRHALASQICTYRQGRLADRSREALEFRASGLNLVVRRHRLLELDLHG